MRRRLEPKLLTPCRDSSGFHGARRVPMPPWRRASAMNASVSRRLGGGKVLPYTELGGVRSREREAKVAGTSL
jgi:hypothetical protein